MHIISPMNDNHSPILKTGGNVFRKQILITGLRLTTCLESPSILRELFLVLFSYDQFQPGRAI